MVVVSVTSKMAIHVATIRGQLPASSCPFFAAVAFEIRAWKRRRIPRSMQGRPATGRDAFTPARENPTRRRRHFKRVFENK